MDEPPAFVVDASVFVADARPGEPYHAEAMALLRALADRDLVLVLPAIALTEVAAAIARATDDAALAVEAAAMYRSWPGARVLPVDEVLADLAAQVAAEERLRGCDAVYVALAQQLGATLVTLDGEQLERSPSTVSARTPGEALLALP